MAAKAVGQISLVDITDAYTVILTSEAYSFTGDVNGAPVGSTCSTQVVAYCGNIRCSFIEVDVANLKLPTGIKADVLNNKGNAPTINFVTTAVISESCEAEIPVIIDHITINKKFSFSVAKAGPEGGTNVQVGGTNLIVNTNVFSRKSLDGMGNMINYGTFFTTDFIEVNAETDYILTLPIVSPSGLTSKIVEYDINKRWCNELQNMTGDKTQKIKTLTQTRYVKISAYSTEGIYKKGYKFEKGTVSTDWSPSPEDTANYMGFDKTNGLIIGEVVGRYTQEAINTSLLKKHVKIDSSSIQIKDASTILGSFSGSSISLSPNGNNSLLIDTQNGIQFKNDNTVIGKYSRTGIELGSTGSNHLSIDTQNGIQFKNGSTVIGKYTGSDVVLGSTGFNHLSINSTNGIQFKNGSTVIGKYSGTGIELGDSNKVSISSTGIEFKNSDNTAVASYKSNLINLGQNSDSTMIKMCGESLIISYKNTNDFTGATIESTGDISIGSNESAYVTVKKSSASASIGVSNGIRDSFMLLNSNSVLLRTSGDIWFTSSSGSFKPYYSPGDSIYLNNLTVSGFIVSNRTIVKFLIPLSKPLLGVTKFTIDSMSIKIFQNRTYLYNSDSGLDLSRKAEILQNSDGNYISITISNLTADSNAINYNPCGIAGSLQITCK